MQSLPNIEKSAFRNREYVGYGQGQVWRVRKHGCGGWEAWVASNRDAHYIRAATLAEVSQKLSAE